jgi:hypothetical protein
LQTFHYYESSYRKGDTYKMCIEWTAASLFSHFLWVEGLQALITAGARLVGGDFRTRSKTAIYEYDPAIMESTSDAPGQFHVLERLLPPMFTLPKSYDSETQFLNVVSMLLDAGALPNLQYSDWDVGSNFRQPIIAAISNKHTDLVRLLLTHGADAETLDRPNEVDHRNTAFGVAMSKDNQVILQLLIDGKFL